MIASARPFAPVLIAALLGAGVAFVTMRTPSSKAPPQSQSSAAPARATAAPPPTLVQPTAVRPASTPAPVAVPSASADAATAKKAEAPSAGGVAGTASVLAPPTTPDQLHESELDCDRKKLPEACERVALSLEAGSAGTKDAARATKLRRIALTLYVKQCETDRAFSCQRLADMYERGETVQKNPKNAAALRARVIELCRVRPNQLGCEPGAGSRAGQAPAPPH